MSAPPLRCPLSGACPRRVRTPGVTLRSTPRFILPRPLGAVVGIAPSSPRRVELNQRRRREGLKPGVKRSETPGIRRHPGAEPLTRGDGKRALEVTLFKGQTMRPQDHFKFFQKRNRSMMFFLSLDVTTNLRNLRLTHRERAVSFLPRESCRFFERPRDPAGRIRLHLTDCFRDCFVRPQLCQDMNMISSAVDDQRDPLFIADRAAQVLMNAGPDAVSQPGLPALCRKNNVIEQVAMGGTHNAARFRRPCSGAPLLVNHTPGVPLRSTPGFNPTHPPGALAGICTSGHGQRVLAPEARGNKARSEAKQTPGMLKDIGEPLARGGGERIWAERRISAGETK